MAREQLLLDIAQAEKEVLNAIAAAKHNKLDEKQKAKNKETKDNGGTSEDAASVVSDTISEITPADIPEIVKAQA